MQIVVVTNCNEKWIRNGKENWRGGFSYQDTDLFP